MLLHIVLVYCFIAPNLPKLARYLEKLNDWEDFGIFLLPEDDAEYLTQVHY